MSGGDVLVLGKIPSEREYLRTEAAVFDEWLTAGFERALEREGPEWATAFSQAKPCIVLWRGERADVPALFGVAAPSHDAVGRAFPVVVVARVPRTTARLAHILFLAYADFLQAADRIIVKAQEVRLSALEVVALAQELELPSASEVGRATSEYDEWCGTTSVERACRQLFADARSRTRAEAMMATMHATRDLGPRCVPLGGASEISAAAFWLDAASRISREGPSAFWRTSDATMLLTAAAPPAAVVADLWPLSPPAQSDAGRSAPPSLPAAISGATMAEYLASLKPASTLVTRWTRAWSR